MGKSVDKRLRDVGASSFYRSAFADEATNMEETVEPWLAGLYPALKELVSGGGVNGAGMADCQPLSSDDAATIVERGEAAEQGQDAGQGAIAQTSSHNDDVVDPQAPGMPQAAGRPKNAVEDGHGEAGAPAAADPACEAVDCCLDQDTLGSDNLVAAVAKQVFMETEGEWSPSADSGVLPLSFFLTAEHKAPNYRPPKDDLPRSRPNAPDIHFPGLDGVDGGGVGGESWLERAKRRSSSVEASHTCDWPFVSRVESARYLTHGGREAERR